MSIYEPSIKCKQEDADALQACLDKKWVPLLYTPILKVITSGEIWHFCPLCDLNRQKNNGRHMCDTCIIAKDTEVYDCKATPLPMAAQKARKSYVESNHPTTDVPHEYRMAIAHMVDYLADLRRRLVITK